MSSLLETPPPPPGQIIPTKNNSAENGTDETNSLSWRNSGCSSEQKSHGIHIRIILRNKKMLGIPYRGTKLEANSRHSVPNHFTEEKTTRNTIPWNKNRTNRSELIPRNFSGKKFRFQPLQIQENFLSQ